MIDFLVPVSKSVIAHKEILPNGVLGKQIRPYINKGEIPSFDSVKFAILGIRENRRNTNYIGEEISFDAIRMRLYSLYPGNWSHHIVDLGDIDKGETVDDTYFAVRTVVESLLDNHIIPLILGGGQDLVYAQYRAYDKEAGW